MSSEGLSETIKDRQRQTKGRAHLLMEICEDMSNFSLGNLAGNRVCLSPDSMGSPVLPL